MPTPILMPALSPTMEEGTLAKWLVKEGDEVSAGDVIAEIETDKATMEVEAVDEGRLGKILIEEGTEEVAVQTPIAVILEEGEDESALEDFDAGGAAPAETKNEAGDETKKEARAGNGKDEGVEAEAAPSTQREADDTGERRAAAEEQEKGKASGAHGERIFASPLARRLADQNDLDLEAIDGSGPRGRVIKRDIEDALEGGAAKRDAKAPTEEKPKEKKAPAREGERPAVDPRAFFEEGSYEEAPLDGMRKTIARRLAEAMREIPHYYETVDCRIDELLSVRKKINEREDVKVSVNDFVIKAAALALRDVPDVNVSFAGDARLLHKHADIGVAVALDGGLITPIVRAAETKGLSVISDEVRDLAERAREKKLKPNEYEGGTFAVSNLGMYGVREFTAVINPPHAAILAVGAGEKRPVVRDDAVAIETMMTVTLSSDHRVVDGALAAQWLQAFKGYIEDPLTMLL